MAEDKPVPAPSGGQNITTRKHNVGVAGLHARLKNPVRTQRDPDTCPNRIALMLDVSGSMSGDNIASLKTACEGFVNSCNYNDTALAIEPFGDNYPSSNRVGLTTMHPILLTTVQLLDAVGGTPMARAMSFVVNTYPVTRGVLVSDGEPDSEQDCFAEAQTFKDAGVPVDCVHIGYSTGGERCLKTIAEMTGGQYIKFTDIQSFSRSFKYLTPAYYAQLTSGTITAAQLGAKEVL